MKKLLIMFFMLLPFLFVKTNVEAEESGYSVTFTASFDNDNVGSPITLTKVYGTRVSFGPTISELTDYEFVYWIVNGVVRSDLLKTHEFIVTGDMDIHAIFTQANEYAVTFMDANGSVISTEYANAGNSFKVTPPSITAAYNKPNHKLSTNLWGFDLETEITENMVLVLQYELDTTSKFELTVDGIVTEHDYNEVVSVTASAKSGEHFHYWKRNGQIVSYDEVIKVSILEDTLLEPVYGLTALTQEKPVIFLSNALTLRTGYKSQYAQFFLPEGYELVEYGMLTVDALYVGFEVNTALLEHDIIKRQAPSYHPGTHEFLMSIKDTKAVSARAYLVYEHNGVISTVYSAVNEPVELTYVPIFIGSPVSNVTAKFASGTSIMNYSIYMDGAHVQTTTNGTTTLPNGFPVSRTVVVINGMPYPVEVK